jgi:GNAT superfamily N-acetyltransferase
VYQSWVKFVPMIAVRRAEPRDAEPLDALMHASRAYQGEYATVLDGYHITADYIAANRVFVAGDCLGFYGLIETQPGQPDHPDEPGLPELDVLFVSDDAQGQGIGRLLVEHMVEQARQAGHGEVRVVSHPPAEGFYLRMGAERIGTYPARPPKVTWERPDLRFRIR